MRVLFAESDGRFAYLYDVINCRPVLRPPPSRSGCGCRTATSARSGSGRWRCCVNSYHEWNLDGASVLTAAGRLRHVAAADPSESVRRACVTPASRVFWAGAMDVDADLSGSDEAPLVGGEQGPIDAGVAGERNRRRGHVRANGAARSFAFGQRVFASASRCRSVAQAVAGRCADFANTGCCC